MKLLIPRKLLGVLAALVLVLVTSVSTEALGQGRGRRALGGFDKKCGKFVNCHDARDGRWDGRGPRRDRDRRFDRRWRRHRGNHRLTRIF
jgi:hypothetical protein